MRGLGGWRGAIQFDLSRRAGDLWWQKLTLSAAPYGPRFSNVCGHSFKTTLIHGKLCIHLELGRIVLAFGARQGKIARESDEGLGNFAPPKSLASRTPWPTPDSEGKNPAAVALGRMGGKARAAGLSARKRKQIAQRAAKSRWSSR